MGHGKQLICYCKQGTPEILDQKWKKLGNIVLFSKQRLNAQKKIISSHPIFSMYTVKYCLSLKETYFISPYLCTVYCKTLSISKRNLFHLTLFMYTVKYCLSLKDCNDRQEHKF